MCINEARDNAGLDLLTTHTSQGLPIQKRLLGHLEKQAVPARVYASENMHEETCYMVSVVLTTNIHPLNNPCEGQVMQSILLMLAPSAMLDSDNVTRLEPLEDIRIHHQLSVCESSQAI